MCSSTYGGLWRRRGGIRRRCRWSSWGMGGGSPKRNRLVFRLYCVHGGKTVTTLSDEIITHCAVDRVSMTEYAWNNNGRAMETFRGGPRTSMFTSRYTIYTLLCTYMRVFRPERKHVRMGCVISIRRSRGARDVLINTRRVYIYIRRYLYTHI